MDDLYRNAWSDQAERMLPDVKPALSSTSWLSPTLALSEEEADLATPSWSTGTGIHWNEPSENSGISWTQTDTDAGWGASTYEGIQLGGPAEREESPPPSTAEADAETQAEIQAQAETETEIEKRETTVSIPQSPKVSAVSDVEPSSPHSPAEIQLPPSVVSSPAFGTLSLPPDQDGFGTFASAISPDEETALALEESEINADAWGSAWATRTDAAESTEEPVDEWETARRLRAKQDRRVPPEVLASILSECDSFVRDAWPTSENGDAEDEEGRKEDWQRGMESVEGLESFVQTFLPPLTLQPPVHFGKTEVAKRMATSVRLTKNMALTKGSPMSHYLAAKGSIAWEVAVKSRKEITEDDVPLGWRILEKEPSHEVAFDANKGKKRASKIFSFWGRKDSSVAHSRTSSQTTSVSQSEAAHSPIIGETDSRRTSHDTVEPTANASMDKIASPVQVSSPASQSTPSASTSAAQSPPPTMSSYSTAPEPQFDQAEVPSPPLPSAVSRFLNRFSRHRSATAPLSSQGSLALSSDDLEFLSDIVPSASDGNDDDFITSLRALPNTVKPTPLPPMLPPPPPAPRRTASPVSRSGSAAPGTQPALDDFDSFFDCLDSGASANGKEVSLSPLNGTAPLKPAFAAVLQPTRPSTPSVSLMPGDSNTPEKSTSPPPLADISTKQPFQPFFLPSPPSSRSHTPIAATGIRSGIPPPIQTMPINAQAKAQADASFGDRAPPPPISRPRSTSIVSTAPSEEIRSPSTPGSARPLAELYPNAYRASAASRSFVLPPPPPPPSRAQILPPPLAPPPPGPSLSRKTTALNIFDNDDFSDYLSSSASSTSEPVLQPVLASTPRVSTPVSTPSSTIPGSAAPVLAPHPVLPGPSSKPPRLSLASTSNFAAFDDDEFSDFHSSAASAHPSTSCDTPLFSEYQSSSSSAIHRSDSSKQFDSPTLDDRFASEKAFLTPGKTVGFDVSSASPMLSTPSPPKPISKTESISPISPQKLAEPQPQQAAVGTVSNLTRAASLKRTLNLMERAAAHPGRWPAPPSPLPEAIPAPPPGPGTLARVDLLGDEWHTKDGPSPSVPALPNAINPSSSATGLGIDSKPTSPLPLFHSQSVRSASKSDVLATRPATTTPLNASRNGRLSAQDLLFFEGL
ncbi:uncharacterized protein LAESUDRAFT_810336 [Laetiporus sulphureus 93-53]|uniref:Uncharacterized protein n=1 Tax=Laetiporus sulphureus 93-53 TaxID=1314785 RepID=A0A165GA30_9APHY|nr:uncharacterized protein LAESUDRAFT_810336 [Laetiporus sulphureus 93-53]KZT10051.1 hypothetical protein LAESUDRAFT_810336 [Laetiporus sulphureus 93-53]